MAADKLDVSSAKSGANMSSVRIWDIVEGPDRGLKFYTRWYAWNSLQPETTATQMTYTEVRARYIDLVNIDPLDGSDPLSLDITGAYVSKITLWS